MFKSSLIAFCVMSTLAVSAYERICIPSFIASLEVTTSLQDVLKIAENMTAIADWKIVAWQKLEREPIKEQIYKLSEKLNALNAIDAKGNSECCSVQQEANNEVQKAKNELNSLVSIDYFLDVRNLLGKVFKHQVEKLEDLIAHCKETPCRDPVKMKIIKDSLHKMHSDACIHYDNVFFDQSLKSFQISRTAFDVIAKAEEVCKA